jgi:sugar lactone lactonase YvrE
LLHSALVVAVAAVGSFSAPAFAACTWAGTPTLGLPEVTPLRAYSNPYRSPGRVAFDALGNAYVTDPGAGWVVVQDRWGRLVSLLTALGTPMAVAVSDAGDILVGDQTTGSVSVFDPQWTLRYQLGQGAGEFQNVTDIAVDASDGTAFVTDGGTHSIRKYDADGEFVASFGGFGDAEELFDFPSAVHVSAAGEVLVGDQNNDRVQVFDRNGQFLRCFGSRSSFFFSRKFGRISGLTTDSQGRIYVTDSFQGHVKVFDLQSVLIGTFGEFGSGPGQLRTPVGLDIDPSNRMFVASQNTGRVELLGLDTFSDPRVVIGVAYVDPPQVKRDSKRKTVKAVIELIDADVYDVDLSSLTANGVASELGSEVIGDANGNGVADITAKFAFDAFIATVPDGESTVAVAGDLINGNIFEGAASITVQGSETLQASTTAQGQRKPGGRI